MTLKTIRQLHLKTISLPHYSRNLSLCNAYTDQALMNLNYETMPITEINKALELIREMINKFLAIQGRKK